MFNYKDISKQIRDNSIRFGFPEDLPFPDFDPKYRGSHFKKDYLLKYFPDFYKFLLVTYPQVDDLRVRLRLLIDGLAEPPRCPVCGKYVKMNANGKFNKHCSNLCGIQDDETKKKTHETCSKRTDEYRKELHEKKKKTCLERYGTENPIELDEFKEKMKQTSIERHGCESYLQTEEGKQRFRETCIKKYGVDNPRKAECVKEKTKQTCIEKYGVDNPTKSQEVIERRRKSNLEKYGTEDPGNTPENIEKRRKTSMERYGVDNPSKSPEVISKISETTMERYGVQWPCQIERPGESEAEKAFEKILVENGLVLGKDYFRQVPIGGMIFDFKVYDTLVEINPTPTHNTVWNPYMYKGEKSKPIRDTYHRDKSELANTAGYHCVHVWDWDDSKKIVRLLLKKTTIGARQCELVGMFPKDPELAEFIDANHLQGKCRGTKVALGLRYNGDLVEVMTFGKPRRNNNFQWEIYRLCTKPGMVVMGGAEKLFKEFVNSYNPDSVISYCDLAKFSGTVYIKMGFSLMRKPAPVCHWSNPKTNQHVLNKTLMDLGYDKLFDAHYGKGTSNEKLMLEHGFVPVFDCGQAAYTWKKS